MPNPYRGETQFVNGEDEYTLVFHVNALCEVEALLDKPWGRVAVELGQRDGASLQTIRALIWAGLRTHHPEIKLAKAGDLISHLGMKRCGEVVVTALEAAFPEVSDDADGEADPPKAKRSTP